VEGRGIFEALGGVSTAATFALAVVSTTRVLGRSTASQLGDPPVGTGRPTLQRARIAAASGDIAREGLFTRPLASESDTWLHARRT
jgi:hypothetical protein